MGIVRAGSEGGKRLESERRMVWLEQSELGETR